MTGMMTGMRQLTMRSRLRHRPFVAEPSAKLFDKIKIDRSFITSARPRAPGARLKW
jgi:hypothetical protein